MKDARKGEIVTMDKEDFKNILEEVVDETVRKEFLLHWLYGYISGLDGDHETALNRIETVADLDLEEGS